MLGKLLKYEIPALGRNLVPLYIGWAVTAALLGVFIGPSSSKMEFGVVFSGMLYSAATTAVVVMAVIMIVQRYSRSLLGDEGYFSHVLPVTAAEHIACKSIAALIWILVSGVALFVTGLIILLFSGEVPALADVDWSFRVTAEDVIGLIEMLVLFALSILKSVLAIYAALTIGHQARQHVRLASIGAYFGALTFEMIMGRLMISILPSEVYEIYSAGDFQKIFITGALVTIALAAVYFFICKYLIENRLNLN